MQLNNLKYPLKPHRIKIFYEDKDASGSVKSYIIPEGKFIKAYAKQLLSGETVSAESNQDSSEYQFVIMKREVSEDMFVEFDNGFGEKTYQISAVDLLEFYNGEIYINAYRVTPKTYNTTRWAT